MNYIQAKHKTTILLLSILSTMAMLMYAPNIANAHEGNNTASITNVRGIKVNVHSKFIHNYQELEDFLLSSTPKDIERDENRSIISVTETTKEALYAKYTSKKRINVDIGSCRSTDLCITSVFGGNYALYNKGTIYVSYTNIEGYFTGKWTAEIWTTKGSLGRSGPLTGNFTQKPWSINKVTIYQ